MAFDHSAPSALSQFDAADLLDALSTGIVMLDRQLCPVYANVAAQDLLAFSLKMARGRPISDFLHDTEGLCRILRRALESGESIADREVAIRPAGAPRELRTLDVTITPFSGLTGTQLLLEIADTTQRQRISRENDLLARLDGSRLMVRQLAHEIKNPLGGLRGAAQLLERELPEPGLTRIHAAHHRRGRPAHGAGRLHGRPDARTRQDLGERARDLRARVSPAARRGARRHRHRARLRPEPAECDARPAPADPGAAERGAQRAAGAGGPAAASCCARARART